MQSVIKEIVLALLRGEDYREYVLAQIQSDFVTTVFDLTQKVFRARSTSQSDDWWDVELIKNSTNKRELCWFGGVNTKTVKNRTGSESRNNCLEMAMLNTSGLDKLFDQMASDTYPLITIHIENDGQSLNLTPKESMRLFNTISAMRSTLRGGAWSKIGHVIQRPLLRAMFILLGLPPNTYEIDPRGADERQIDAIIFYRYNVIRVELKLLGIGNPELADQALARPIQLFLADRISPMMQR